LLAGAAAGLREAAAHRHTPHPDGPAHPSGASGSPVTRTPGHGARVERMLEPIRRAMGEPVVAQWFGEGSALGPDEAIVLALGDEEAAAKDEDAELWSTPSAASAGTPGAPSAPAASGTPGTATGEDAPGAGTPRPSPRTLSMDVSGTEHPAAPAGTPAGSARELGSAATTTGPVAAPSAPVTPPSTLTAREREIAQLIARGLSNKGIARELVISPATAARHVANILTKLGFNSRAQIAVWAVDHQLADQPQLR
ncbi:hypothetical protein DZF91_25270, partial [Actinomadura logoneensis]